MYVMWLVASSGFVAWALVFACTWVYYWVGLVFAAALGPSSDSACLLLSPASEFSPASHRSLPARRHHEALIARVCGLSHTSQGVSLSHTMYMYMHMHLHACMHAVSSQQQWQQ